MECATDCGVPVNKLFVLGGVRTGANRRPLRLSRRRSPTFTLSMTQYASSKFLHKTGANGKGLALTYKDFYVI